MALPHAILVSLCEQRGSGYELARRFDRSIGYFWAATHQQIYRTLRAMENNGWVRAEVVAQSTRPDKRVYDVTASGRGELARWISEPLCGRGSTTDSRTRELAVKIRGAQFGEADAVCAQAVSLRRERSETLDTYLALEERQFPEPSSLTDSARNQYLVLRRGIRTEQGCVDWLDEVLSALGGSGE